MQNNTPRNIIIGILVIIIIVLGFLLVTQKSDTNDHYPPGDVVLIDTSTPDPTPKPVQSESAPSASLDNTTTPLIVKKIYQKNNVWWADVDYVTHISGSELLKFQIERGECTVPNMTKSQMLAYAATLNSTNAENNAFIGHCSPDLTSDPYVLFEFGATLNQNSQIRSFPFAQNFKTTNYCPADKNPSVTEYQTLANNSPYKYGIYNTSGFYIKSVTITNGEISLFNFVNGCAG